MVIFYSFFFFHGGLCLFSGEGLWGPGAVWWTAGDGSDHHCAAPQALPSVLSAGNCTQGLGNFTELGGKTSPAKPFQGHPKSQVRVVLEQGWSGVDLCTVMKGWVSQKWSQEMVISHQVAFHLVGFCYYVRVVFIRVAFHLGGLIRWSYQMAFYQGGLHQVVSC